MSVRVRFEKAAVISGGAALVTLGLQRRRGVGEHGLEVDWRKSSSRESEAH